MTSVITGPRSWPGINLIPPVYGHDLATDEDEQTALRERAEAEGISMQEAARRAAPSNISTFVTSGVEQGGLVPK
ncbi:MAG: hypothetical protein ABI276_05055 [Acidimicrobiales bacterium]